MIYGQIYTQNCKSVFVKQITYLKLKFDDEEKLWKIKAHFSGRKKTTLGKYESEECAKVIFESVSLFAGQDVHDYDSEFNLIKERENKSLFDDILNLFSGTEDGFSYCRLYMPAEDEVVKFLKACDDKKVNPYITEKLQSEFEKDHPHYMTISSYMHEENKRHSAEAQKSKGIVELGKFTLDDIRKDDIGGNIR